MLLLRRALSGALLLGLAAGTAGYATLERTVTLRVDGEPRTLRTFAGTVGGALDRAGIAVGPHDTLAPGASAALRDDSEVVLRRGRLLDLTVDGQARQVWVTALSVAEALDQIGLRADHAVLSASRSRQIGTDGLALDVRLPRPVTVVADGVPTPTLTTASTVSDLLAERGLTLGSLDRVSAPLDSALTTGQEVRVTRVRVEHAYEPVPLPEGTVERADPGLPAGTRRAGEPGAPGALERTLLVTYTDGVETARAVVGEVVVTAPRPAVILVGTRPPPPPAPPARAAAPRPAAAPVPPASAGGLDWAALARCESGGNPRAASPNGLYFGLYQFSLPTWNSVGGTGNPVDASPEEQTARAQLLYSRSGAAPWPTCGRYL